MRLLLLGLLFLQIQDSYCINCLDCKNIEDLSNCGEVVECEDDQVCYIEKVLSSETFTPQYNTGCKSMELCTLQLCNKQAYGDGNSRRKRQTKAGESLTLCSECCYDDSCNTEGCGYVPHPNNVSKCYDCKEVYEGGPICATTQDCDLKIYACSVTLSKDSDRPHAYDLGCTYKRSQCEIFLNFTSDKKDENVKCCDKPLCNINPYHTKVNKTSIAENFTCPTGIVRPSTTPVLSTSGNTTTKPPVPPSTSASAQATTHTSVSPPHPPTKHSTIQSTAPVISPSTKTSNTVATFTPASTNSTPVSTVPSTATNTTTTPPATTSATTVPAATTNMTSASPTTAAPPTMTNATMTLQSTIANTTSSLSMTNTTAAPLATTHATTVASATLNATSAPSTTTTAPLATTNATTVESATLNATSAPSTTTTAPLATTNATTVASTTLNATSAPSTTTTAPPTTTTTPPTTTTAPSTTTAQLLTTSMTTLPPTTKAPPTTKKVTTSTTSTSTTKATTTPKPTAPAVQTQPAVTRSCAVCAGPKFLCEKLFSPTPCHPPNNYCINTIANHKDGTKTVDRKCGGYDECYREWFLGSSDNDKCRKFTGKEEQRLNFQCTFCCIEENCNSPLHPAENTLYKPV